MDFLNIKIDIGEVWKQLEIAKREQKDQVDFVAFFNKDKEEDDNKPLFRSNTVAVWKNTKKEEE